MISGWCGAAPGGGKFKTLFMRAIRCGLIPSCRTAGNLRAELVLDALEMAVGQRQPKDVIHQSDQGSEYTSVAFGKRCGEAGVRPSMGSVGDAYDNAMAESFFSTLEAELLGRRRFASQAEARMACFSYIEGWYNLVRLH